LRYIKRRLAFLKQTDVPACLVEPAYISNAEDLEFARKNVKYIARAIKNGIMVWIEVVT